MNPIALVRDFNGYHHPYVLHIRRRYTSDCTGYASVKLGGPIKPFRRITANSARFARIKFGVDVLWLDS
jgi:hypothetical protein